MACFRFNYRVDRTTKRRWSLRMVYFFSLLAFCLGITCLFVLLIELLAYWNHQTSLFDPMESTTEKSTTTNTVAMEDTFDIEQRRYCGEMLEKEDWGTDNQRPLCMDYDGTLVDSRLAYNFAASEETGTPSWSKLNRGTSSHLTHRHIASYLLANYLKSKDYMELFVLVDRCSDTRADLTVDIRSIGRQTIAFLAREMDITFKVKYHRADVFDATWLLDAELTMYAISENLYAQKNVTLLVRFVMCCKKLGVTPCELLVADKIRCGSFVSANDRYLATCASMDNCTATRILCPACGNELSNYDLRKMYESAYESDGILVDPAAYTIEALHRKYSGVDVQPLYPSSTSRPIIDVQPLYPSTTVTPQHKPERRRTDAYNLGKFCETIVV